MREKIELIRAWRAEGEEKGGGEIRRGGDSR